MCAPILERCVSKSSIVKIVFLAKKQSVTNLRRRPRPLLSRKFLERSGFFGGSSLHNHRCCSHCHRHLHCGRRCSSCRRARVAAAAFIVAATIAVTILSADGKQAAAAVNSTIAALGAAATPSVARASSLARCVLATFVAFSTDLFWAIKIVVFVLPLKWRRACEHAR